MAMARSSARRSAIKRAQAKAPGIGPLDQACRFQNPPPCHLGLHDFIGFLQQSGYEAEGNGHHHGQFMEGNLMALKGFNSSSIPSVKAMGEVVRVKRDVPVTRNTSLRAIKKPCLKPSLVTRRNQMEKSSVSPGVKNILIKKVRRIMNIRGFRPLSIYFTGILDRAMVSIINARM